MTGKSCGNLRRPDLQNQKFPIYKDVSRYRYQSNLGFGSENRPQKPEEYKLSVFLVTTNRTPLPKTNRSYLARRLCVTLISFHTGLSSTRRPNGEL